MPAVSPASEMAAPAGQDLAGDPRRWLILGVVLAGTFIAIVDVSIVNPGATHVRNALSAAATSSLALARELVDRFETSAS